MPQLIRWQEIALNRKLQQEKSIPNEWKIPKPPADMHNVTSIPASCGVLTENELEITGENDVETILERLGSGTWTAVEVSTAYLKRATVAHQLVST